MARRGSLLHQIALRDLKAQLEAASDEERPRILARRQVDNFHVRALGAAIGLKLSDRDTDALCGTAERAIRGNRVLLAEPVEELVATTGVVMRTAVAEQLAVRCSNSGAELLRRVTDGCLPDPRWRPVGLPDWRALIVERWFVLPILHPIDIAAFLRDQLASPLSAGEMGVPALQGRLKRPSALVA